MIEREARLAEDLADGARWAAVAAVYDLRGETDTADETWAEAWRLTRGDLRLPHQPPWLDAAAPLTERYLAVRSLEERWAPGPLLGLWRHLWLVSGDREEWLAATERLRPRVQLGAGWADDLPRAARAALATLAIRRLKAERLDDRALAAAFGSARHARRAEHAAGRRGLPGPPPADESVLALWAPRAAALCADWAAAYRRGVLALCDRGAG
ncbi:MAG: hypothetical protein HZB16_09295 [Armatimonadetes bacterium]|nr:hypothetical protein [Armatimonadota bacterium]